MAVLFHFDFAIVLQTVTGAPARVAAPDDVEPGYPCQTSGRGSSMKTASRSLWER